MQSFQGTPPRRLPGSTVVITGTSSGIGRTATLEFARKRAHVVLADRRADVLESLVRECEHLGVDALAVKTDVSDEATVDALSPLAMERVGGFDVWVTNADVYWVGAFVNVPSQDVQPMIDVKVSGYVYRPENAARAIVALAQRPKRLAVVGGFGHFMTWLYPTMPTLFERLAAPLLRSQHMHRTPSMLKSGNLFHASPEGTSSSGGWLHSVSLLTRKTPACAKRD